MPQKIVALILALSLLLPLAGAATAGEIPNISAEELKARLNQPRQLMVIDVRTNQEYRQGHISGAINIPPDQFEQIASLLPSDKNIPLVFYCRGYD